MRTGPRLLTTLLPAPLAFALSATSLTACRNSEIAAGSDTAFATMPGATSEGRAEVGNWLMAIPRGARNRDVTFDFLTWATRPERMKKSALAGNPPTRRSVFNDAELLAKFPSYPAQLRSLETSKPRPRTPLWNEIENVFGIFLSRANGGELSPEDAMNQANAEIARTVARGR